MAEIIETTKIWTCKIGEVAPGVLPPGADGPMRDAVEQAYRLITGRDADFTFSGWGGSLTEPERAVVENRLPMADEIDALVAGLRARHVRRSDDAWPVPYCERCDGDWPCDATRAADALDALRTRLAASEEARCDAMALVLNHEGHIEKLTARLAQVEGERDGLRADVTELEQQLDETHEDAAMNQSGVEMRLAQAEARVRALAEAVERFEGIGHVADCDRDIDENKCDANPLACPGTHRACTCGWSDVEAALDALAAPERGDAPRGGD